MSLTKQTATLDDKACRSCEWMCRQPKRGPGWLMRQQMHTRQKQHGSPPALTRCCRYCCRISVDVARLLSSVQLSYTFDFSWAPLHALAEQLPQAFLASVNRQPVRIRPFFDMTSKRAVTIRAQNRLATCRCKVRCSKWWHLWTPGERHL